MSVRIETTKEEWWQFLIPQLFNFLEEYYITTRILYFNYNTSIIHSIIHNWAESIEKILKFYISINNENIGYKNLKYIWHDIKELLNECININTNLFTNKELNEFAKGYSMLWNQIFRYWLNSNYKNEFVKWYWMNIDNFIEILDYLFFSVMKDLYNKNHYFYLAYSWKIGLLYGLNYFLKIYKEEKMCYNDQNIKKALEFNNKYIKEFLDNIYNFSLTIKNDEKK